MKKLILLSITVLLATLVTGMEEEIPDEITWCETQETSSEEERGYCYNGPDKESCCEYYSELTYSDCMNTDDYGTCFQIANNMCVDMAWWASREYCDDLFIINPEDFFAYLNCIANKEFEYLIACMMGPEFNYYMQWCMGELESLNIPYCLEQKQLFFDYCMEN